MKSNLLNYLRKKITKSKNKIAFAAHILLMFDFVLYQGYKYFNKKNLFYFLKQYIYYYFDITNREKLYTRKKPVKRNAKIIFSKIWPKYGSADFNNLVAYQKNRILKNFRSAFFKGKEVADIGCGNGALMIAISKYIKRGFLFDVNCNYKKYLKKYKNLHMVKSFRSIPKVDLAVCNGVIHHLNPQEQKTLLIRINALLKNQGYMLITVAAKSPFLNNIQTILQKSLCKESLESILSYVENLKISRGKKTFLMDTLMARYYYFTRSNLLKLLKENKFRFIRRLRGGSLHSHDSLSNSANPIRKLIIGDGDYRFLVQKND